MHLDTSTMVLMIAVSCFLNMLLLLIQYLINRHFKGVSYWLTGFFIVGLSQVIAAQRLTIEVVHAVFLSDILLIAGFLVLSTGLKVFLRQKTTPVIHITMLVIVFVSALFYLRHQNETLEQAILLLALGSVMMIIARDLFKSHQSQKNYTAFFLGSLHIIYGSLLWFQCILDFSNYKHPTPRGETLLPYIYFLSFITSNIATFCYVMLINNQLVTERQAAVDALQISENKYRKDFLLLQAILESPQDIIVFSLDTNYCYTAFTSFHKKLMKEIWGVPIAEGMSILEVVGNDTEKNTIKKNLDRAFGGEVFVIEEMHHARHIVNYFESWYSPIRNPNGSIEGASVFVLDVSKRKHIEQEIIEAKNHFETLFKVSPDAAMITSFPDGTIIDVNDSFVNNTGYAKEEVVGKKTVEIGIWQNTNNRDIFIQQLRENGVVNNLEAGYITKNGRNGVGVVSAKIYEVNGSKRLISITHDISARKKAEQEKEFEKKNKEALINSTSDLIWSVKKDYTFITGNQAFIERMKLATGINVTPGMNLLEPLFYTDDVIQFWKKLYDDAFDGKSVKTEAHWKNDKEEIIEWAELKMEAIEVNGMITGIACYWKNITERKGQELLMKGLNEELKIRAQELALSNAELEQFAYIASHDLQEPLRMISSFLSLLDKKYTGLLDEKGKQYIHFAVDGAERMRQIIVDLLEYSRTGKNAQPAEKIDTDLMLKELVEINKLMIEDKQAVISWKDLPIVITEKLSLQQIFQNLMANGIKYSRKGVTPYIHIRATEHDESWEFAVEDNGIGIDPIFFKKIFIVFQRLHGREEYSGNGIGLAICKKLIEQQGGRIWLSSVPGEGSTFYFTLPKILRH